MPLPIGTMHAPASIYVKMTSQSHSTPWRHNRKTKTLLRAHVNGTVIGLKYTDKWLNITLFLHVQGLNHGYLTVFISTVMRLNCFSKMWHILLPRILKITIYSVNWKRRCDHTWRLSRVHYIFTMHCIMHSQETMHRKPCYNSHSSIDSYLI